MHRFCQRLWRAGNASTVRWSAHVERKWALQTFADGSGQMWQGCALVFIMGCRSRCQLRQLHGTDHPPGFPVKNSPTAPTKVQANLNAPKLFFLTPRWFQVKSWRIYLTLNPQPDASLWSRNKKKMCGTVIQEQEEDVCNFHGIPAFHSYVK